MKTKMYVNWYDHIIYTEEEYNKIKNDKLQNWINDFCTFEQFMDEYGCDRQACFKSMIGNNRDYLDNLKEEFEAWCYEAINDELQEKFDKIEKDF